MSVVEILMITDGELTSSSTQMSTHVPGFHTFSVFLYHCALAKLATSSIRVYSMKIDYLYIVKPCCQCDGQTLELN